MIKVSAPGKLLLMGDHAVVYGYPSIVTAIDARLFVTLEKATGDRNEIIAPQTKNTDFINSVLRRFRKDLEQTKSYIKVTTQSPFTGKYGFGSSSAVTVATIAAIHKFLGLDIDPGRIFREAYTTVLDVQKIGSGFDVAAASYGGTIYYVRGGATLETLIEADREPIPLIIGYSGVKSNSVDLINEVKKKRTQYPQKVDQIFKAIAKLVEEGRERIAAKDWERLGKLFDFNQEYLRDLGVSSQKLEELISAAKGAGAWGAKLSGAGGGDCMIALADPAERAQVEEAIRKAGGEVVKISANARGVFQETTDNQDEIFIVVDKDDNVTGFKSRYECHHNPDLIHRSVGLLVYNSRGELLLQKRSQSKDLNPGLWTISTSGHVAQGQSYQEALEREVREELGVSVRMYYLKRFIIKTGQESEMATLYKAVADGPFRPSPEEVSELKFFNTREIPFLVASKTLKLTPGAEITLKEAGLL